MTFVVSVVLGHDLNSPIHASPATGTLASPLLDMNQLRYAIRSNLLRDSNGVFLASRNFT